MRRFLTIGSGVQEFRSSGVQEFRSSGVQEFRSSGVQEFRSSDQFTAKKKLRKSRTSRLAESEYQPAEFCNS
jgi:hypothetical protein